MVVGLGGLYVWVDSCACVWGSLRVCLCQDFESSFCKIDMISEIAVCEGLWGDFFPLKLNVQFLDGGCDT